MLRQAFLSLRAGLRPATRIILFPSRLILSRNRPLFTWTPRSRRELQTHYSSHRGQNQPGLFKVLPIIFAPIILGAIMGVTSTWMTIWIVFRLCRPFPNDPPVINTAWKRLCFHHRIWRTLRKHKAAHSSDTFFEDVTDTFTPLKILLRDVNIAETDTAVYTTAATADKCIFNMLFFLNMTSAELHARPRQAQLHLFYVLQGYMDTVLDGAAYKGRPTSKECTGTLVTIDGKALHVLRDADDRKLRLFNLGPGGLQFDRSRSPVQVTSKTKGLAKELQRVVLQPDTTGRLVVHSEDAVKLGEAKEASKFSNTAVSGEHEDHSQ